MNSITFKLASEAPMMMHNQRLSNPLDPIVKEIGKITRKGKKKTDDDYAAISWLEFQGGLYWRKETGPYMPCENLHSFVNSGARAQKKGKDVNKALWVMGDAKLIYAGPREPEAMFKLKEKFVDTRTLKLPGQGRVLRTRPIFHEWSLEFTVSFRPDIMDAEDVIRFVSDASSLSGLGDSRPRYGICKSEVISQS